MELATDYLSQKTVQGKDEPAFRDSWKSTGSGGTMQQCCLKQSLASEGNRGVAGILVCRTTQRCPHLNFWNIWLYYFTWPKRLCRCNKILGNYPGLSDGPSVITRGLKANNFMTEVREMLQVTEIQTRRRTWPGIVSLKIETWILPTTSRSLETNSPQEPLDKGPGWSTCWFQPCATLNRICSGVHQTLGLQNCGYGCCFKILHFWQFVMPAI